MLQYKFIYNNQLDSGDKTSKNYKQCHIALSSTRGNNRSDWRLTKFL